MERFFGLSKQSIGSLEKIPLLFFFSYSFFYIAGPFAVLSAALEGRGDQLRAGPMTHTA